MAEALKNTHATTVDTSTKLHILSRNSPLLSSLAVVAEKDLEEVGDSPAAALVVDLQEAVELLAGGN
jgi:hypothetical protein